MKRNELDQFLRKETRIEKEQKKHGENITESELVYYLAKRLKEATAQGEETKLFELPEELFFKYGDIHISKHNRYAAMPEHRHTFLELNYMYSGKSIQNVNGREIVLEQGEFIMFDRGTAHEFKALAKNDILINLILKFDVVTTDIITKLAQKQSIVTDFLINSNSMDTASEGYLVFRSGDDERIQNIMRYMINYYFEDKIPNMEMLQMYLPILFAELLRCYHDTQVANQYKKTHKKDLMIKILQYIEDEYRTVNLEVLANHVGFNKNYLSNLIKKETGRTFKEILQKHRLEQAYHLVIHTNDTIENISYEVGLKDPSYFYRKFKEVYGMSPAEMRNKI